MITFGRSWEAGSEYRYGFNGKESDKETYGDGNIYDYGFRIFNPRLGKFLSVDPLTKSYPELTPYQFASNRPIDGVDLDGLEYMIYHILIDKRTGIVKISYIEDLTDMSDKQVQVAHGMSKAEFLKQHSVTYGAEGQGVKFQYTIINRKGKIQTKGMWQQSGLLSYGKFAGSGCVTKFGPYFRHDELLNPYAFWRRPIDMGDAMARKHDQAEEGGDYTSWRDPKYVSADIRFVKQLRVYLENANDPNYVDPFTGKPPSEEAIKFAQVAVTAFTIEISLKLDKISENTEMYDDEWYKENVTEVWKEEVIMPSPSESTWQEEKPLTIQLEVLK